MSKPVKLIGIFAVTLLPLAASAQAKQRLVGYYDVGGGQKSEITFTSPSLIVWFDRPLLARDDSTFFSTTDYSTVRFPSDSTGAVSRLDWGPGTWATGDEHLRFPRVRARP